MTVDPSSRSHPEPVCLGRANDLNGKTCAPRCVAARTAVWQPPFRIMNHASPAGHST